MEISVSQVTLGASTEMAAAITKGCVGAQPGWKRRLPDPRNERPQNDAEQTRIPSPQIRRPIRTSTAARNRRHSACSHEKTKRHKKSQQSQVDTGDSFREVAPRKGLPAGSASFHRLQRERADFKLRAVGRDEQPIAVRHGPIGRDGKPSPGRRANSALVAGQCRVESSQPSLGTPIEPLCAAAGKSPRFVDSLAFAGLPSRLCSPVKRD